MIEGCEKADWPLCNAQDEVRPFGRPSPTSVYPPRPGSRSLRNLTPSVRARRIHCLTLGGNYEHLHKTTLMKTKQIASTLSVVLLIAFTASSQDAPDHEFLESHGIPPKAKRLSLESIDRKQFLSEANIKKIIATGRWQSSGIGPDNLIERFKQAFESSIPMFPLSAELEFVAPPPVLSPMATRILPHYLNAHLLRPARSAIRWSDIYFLTVDGDFLTFGESNVGFIFYTRKTAGVLLTTTSPTRSS